MGLGVLNVFVLFEPDNGFIFGLLLLEQADIAFAFAFGVAFGLFFSPTDCCCCCCQCCFLPSGSRSLAVVDCNCPMGVGKV